MARRPRRVTPGYVAILLCAFVIAIAASWTNLAARMDRDAYDWMFRVQPAASGEAVVIAIDEETLKASRGMRDVRTTLARVINALIPSAPAVVAVDIILPDEGDPREDAKLAESFARTPNLILPSDLLPGTGRWQDPIKLFQTPGAPIAHVHAAPDPVSRVLPLELVGGRDRRWAMALEAARLRVGAQSVIESPTDLQIGNIHIPATRDTARELFIRYREGIPVISAAAILADPRRAEAVRGKAAFIGITALTAAHDRLMTPLLRSMTGVEIHAQAFETIMDGEFLRPVSLSAVVLLCLIFTAAAGAVFALLNGWAAYAAGALILASAHAAPHVAFANELILPYLAPIWCAWLSTAAAATWQHFVVRRQLHKSESDKARYQQAIHFVTHEMRSPLTAIQGSSELMGRYSLTEDKRKQMAQMINSESKRLARMIQTFLDIERLTDGQMEIRSEPFELADVIDTCLDRARALAERKGIEMLRGEIASATLNGDRELMEYAVYNLLTNAVKYSPADTTVSVSSHRNNDDIRLSVMDQGIGMDDKEIRNIFKKFYRTKKAEASGEVGTGIGLSLVQQIVEHHSGHIEVTSRPGAGSCFTMVLPAVPASKLVNL